MPLKKIKAHLTAFASSSKFTKGVRLWKKFGLPPINYPKTPAEWNAACPELYVALKDCVEKFILTEDQFLAYQPERRDPKVASLDVAHHSREVDLIQLWSLLRRHNLLPIDPIQGIKWTRWQTFVRSVRRDESVFSRIEPTGRSVSREEALTA